MSHGRRSNLVGGLILILLGGLILALRLLPGLQFSLSWPWIIVGFGVLILVIGSATGVPGLAIPACIIAGIGGILYYQTATEDWNSWTYIWSLIPGFVGVGILLTGLLGEEGGEAIRAGSWLILISLLMFAAFGSLFGALGMVGRYWPVLLIILGLTLLVGPLVRRRR